MANMLRRASQALRRTLWRHAARLIHYERPGDQVVSLTAAAGDRLFDVVGTEDGLLTKLRLRDYLIDRPALVFDGNQVEPRAGDIIRETIEGVELQFIVTAPADGEPAWRWADADCQLLRVHTKQVGI